jgi:hypothetical protein
MGYKQRTTIQLLGGRPTSKYVITPQALLLDSELTSDARLVGIYLLSLSDGWEINQEQIAKALGWPTKSKRVGAAMRCLIAQGWLRHNEHKSGNRTFRHVYVMNRSRRFNTVESTPLYAVDSTPSPKYQENNTDDHRESSGVGGVVDEGSRAQSGSPDGDRDGVGSTEASTAAPGTPIQAVPRGFETTTNTNPVETGTPQQGTAARLCLSISSTEDIFCMRCDAPITGDDFEQRAEAYWHPKGDPACIPTDPWGRP